MLLGQPEVVLLQTKTKQCLQNSRAPTLSLENWQGDGEVPPLHIIHNLQDLNQFFSLRWWALPVIFTLNNFGSGSRIMNRKYPSGSHIVDRKYPKFLVSCLWRELLRWTHEKFHSRETTWTLQSKWGRGFWTRILENCMNDSTLGLNKYCSNCTALRGLGYVSQLVVNQYRVHKYPAALQ